MIFLILEKKTTYTLITRYAKCKNASVNGYDHIQMSYLNLNKALTILATTCEMHGGKVYVGT